MDNFTPLDNHHISEAVLTNLQASQVFLVFKIFNFVNSIAFQPEALQSCVFFKVFYLGKTCTKTNHQHYNINTNLVLIGKLALSIGASIEVILTTEIVIAIFGDY